MGLSSEFVGAGTANTSEEVLEALVVVSVFELVELVFFVEVFDVEVLVFLQPPTSQV